jgi:hypothetical protein
MPVYLNGAEHYHMVRIREAKSSNLFTPTGVHMALIREVLSSFVPARIIDLMACP